MWKEETSSGIPFPFGLHMQFSTNKVLAPCVQVGLLFCLGFQNIIYSNQRDLSRLKKTKIKNIVKHKLRMGSY